MPGYTRQDAANKISNGSVIDADVLDSEFDALVDVFSSDAGVGHNHNGQGEGARITVVGPAGDVTITSNEIVPNNTTVNLGTSGAPFADAWLSGTATIDTVLATTVNIDGGAIDGTTIGGTTPAAVTTTSLTATTADINGGTIDGTVIGGTTPQAITGTTITANTGFTGNVTGTVSDISNHDTDALAEGSTNLYYTDARAKAAIGVTISTGLAYNSTTGEFSGIDATTDVKGVARFNQTDFSVTAGVVSIAEAITATSLVTTGNVTVEGNLYVNGTTTVVNTESVSIADNIITLNSDFITGTPTADAGFEVLRGSEPTVAFTWDESEDHFSTNGQPIKPSSLKIGNFEIVDNGATLYIKYFGTVVASIDGNGDIVAGGDVVAYGNPL